MSERYLVSPNTAKATPPFLPQPTEQCTFKWSPICEDLPEADRPRAAWLLENFATLVNRLQLDPALVAGFIKNAGHDLAAKMNRPETAHAFLAQMKQLHDEHRAREEKLVTDFFEQFISIRETSIEWK